MYSLQQKLCNTKLLHKTSNLFKANQIADGKILRYVIHETFAMNGLLSAFQVCGTSVVIGVVTYNVRGERKLNNF